MTDPKEIQSLSIVKPKPELMPVGDRRISTHGFRTPLALEHLKGHLGQRSGQWCELGCLVRTFEGRNSKQGRISMRRRLPQIFKAALSEGLFLAIEYAHGEGHHGEAKAVKIYEANHSEQERQYAEEQLRRMRKRKEITDENFERARQLLCPL